MSRTELRKAAVLLLSLPGRLADALLARLARHESAAVVAEMARVNALSIDEQEAVILEFAQYESPPTANVLPAAPADERSRLATDDISSRPVEVMDRRPPTRRPFGFLQRVECRRLARLLADERPQTIALVASHVPAPYGAEMIASLEPERQRAVIRAVAAMEPTDPAVVDDVAAALAARVRAATVAAA
jgi:flagellar motor switch protein FliG